MSTDQLVQVEPDYGNKFVPRPFSLEPDELAELPVTVAKGSTQVLAWVRYPAIAERVLGVALAWTQRAVYVEWEARGIHRVWVWASAVERAADGAAGATVVSESPPASAITALGRLGSERSEGAAVGQGKRPLTYSFTYSLPVNR